MTKRSDIIDGRLAAGRKYGLIYTRKCGWIDLGHANPVGATELWVRVRDETGVQGHRPGYHVVRYAQMMGNRWLKVGREKRYAIRKGLNVEQKQSVALSIFLGVSRDFEALQGNWFFRQFTNSGFSAEDLVSNLVGFYRAVHPGTPFVQLCDPMSEDVALGLWDKYGEVGKNKNHSLAPYLYPTPGSGMAGPMSVPLPPFLNTIVPAEQGTWFEELP